MNKVIFSLGTNMGNRLAHLEFAQNRMNKSLGRLVAKSYIYESAAWGNTRQDAFLNQILVYETSLDAFACLNKIQNIENQRFRKRNEAWGPRTLDIDILFFNEEIINSHRLIIPHPFIAKRLFVLLPLSEILSELIHPVLKKSIQELLMDCTDKSEVNRFANGI